MPDNTLTLRINGQVTLRKFARALDRLQALVSGLSLVKRAQRVEWVVSDLAVSSAIATVQGVGEAERVLDVVDAYTEIGAALQRGERLTYPKRVTKPAYDLRGVVGNGVEAVVFDTFRGDAVITSPVVTPATGALTLVGQQADISMPGQGIGTQRAYPPSYGAVAGQVETLARRNTLRFILYDLLHNRAVSCYVEEGHEEDMRDIWGRFVTVEGLVSRDPLTGRPMSVRRITNIVKRTERGSYRDARGASPFHAVPPEDLIRRVRDGW